MTEEERFTAWTVWVRKIAGNVQDLLERRSIFREVQRLVDANPRLQTPNVFFAWLASNYASAAVMRVRREMDKASRAVSLVRLLRDIRRHPQILSWNRVMAAHPPENRERARTAFGTLTRGTSKRT